MASGPIPKRSEERIRRNKDEVAVDRVVVQGVVEAPPLGSLISNASGDDEVNSGDYHPIAQELYEAMTRSGQSKYYEPSDWAMAKVLCHMLSRVLWSGKPSSQMLAALNSLMSALLLTEGDRRRVRMEIDRDNAIQEVTNAAQVIEERMKAMKPPERGLRAV